jgi:hypothetical protein
MRSRLWLLPLTLAMAVVTAVGQSNPPQKPAAKDTQKEKPKKVKVWTNEDLEALRGRPAVSVIGSSAPSGYAASSYPSEEGSAAAPYDQSKDPRWYLERLKPLRDQLDQIDARTKELQNLLANPSTGAGLNLNDRRVSLSPQNELNELQKRRAKVQQQIDEVEDEARRNGIEPGALR